jgi:hypothetical protein
MNTGYRGLVCFILLRPDLSRANAGGAASQGRPQQTAAATKARVDQEGGAKASYDGLPGRLKVTATKPGKGAIYRAPTFPVAMTWLPEQRIEWEYYDG